MATATKTSRTLISSQSVAAGGSASGTLSLLTALGAWLVATITNGATAPTTVATLYVYTSVDGTNWDPWFSREGKAGNSEELVVQCPVDATVRHIKAEVTDHTGQAVTVEVLAHELTSVG